MITLIIEPSLFDDYLMIIIIIWYHFLMVILNYLTANYFEYLILSDYLKATLVAEQVD
jgi:hypothetical protein